MIYTAQHGIAGLDVIDITVKGNHVVGKYFAPTWDMVMDYKRTGDEAKYTKLYYDLLIHRYNTDPGMVEVLHNMVRLFGGEHDRSITLTCYCKRNTFCHRYLLIRFLEYNYKIHYGGER